jgi:hypothetical protein
MSEPVYNTLCTECNYIQMFKSPRFCEYESDDGIRVSVERTAAWCYHCEKVVYVECLPFNSKEEIRKIIQDLTEITKISERIQDVKKKDDLPSHPKQFLLDVHKLTFNIFLFKMSYLETFKRMEVFFDRASPPRCLECGSTSFRVITFSQKKENSQHMSDFQHPGCGGYLYREEFLHIAWAFDRLPIHIYNTEGNLKRVEKQK